MQSTIVMEAQEQGHATKKLTKGFPLGGLAGGGTVSSGSAIAFVAIAASPRMER